MEQLGINLPFLVAQIINFLVIMTLLRMFLYKPMLNMLETRRERIRESLSAAETAKAEAATRNRENEEIIAQARREAQDIIRQAQENAKRQEVDILAQARQEADTVRQRAEGDIAQERQQAMASLRDEVAQLSLAIARKTIGASLVNEQAHSRIVEEILAGGTK
ncbi:MAG: F0F1 ATP synthase subunit B [Ardenticatenales bacterium]|nr:F0F1 ATP synthase subunit B [Ardenticatenales bacterium]